MTIWDFIHQHIVFMTIMSSFAGLGVIVIIRNLCVAYMTVKAMQKLQSVKHLSKDEFEEMMSNAKTRPNKHDS